MAVVRAWALGAVALGVWFLCVWVAEPKKPDIAVAPNGPTFSVVNAQRVLKEVLGPEKPHPVGSAEDAAVRARILKELAVLHVPARTYTAFTCNPWRGLVFVACATVTDIIADVVPGSGKAIVMMAHYDSVPAGPGASDDQSGVATILETIRALKVGDGKNLHPVMALITDGEEAGLLGANAFLQNPALKDRVGAVVNVEARGTRGQSLLFQTSPGDARLIDLYAAHAPVMATSSLYAEIYKFLPNDTDLTLFLHEGFPAFNFAFVENVRYYHTPMDTFGRLSRATLKMHGDNLLGVVRGLGQTDFAALKDGDAVYVSVLGLWLPRMAMRWALPLSIVAFVVIALAAWFARRRPALWPTVLLDAVMPLALIVGCVAVGFALAFVGQIISGTPDPTYAFPLPMRIALAFGVWGMALLVSRMADGHGAATSAWLWMAGLAVLSAATLPGLSPYFLFPSLIAAVLMLATSRWPGWAAGFGQAALFVSALAALVIWFQLVASGEALMGLRLHPLFTLPAAFGLLALVPLLSARPMVSGGWLASVVFAFVVALGGAIAAGIVPAYSAASPQRLNLIYFEDAKGNPHWIADSSWKAKATEAIPKPLKVAGGFAYDKNAYGALELGDGYSARAGASRYPLPTAHIVSDKISDGLRVVTVDFRGSESADAMTLRIPKEAQLQTLDLRGQHIASPKGWSGATIVGCVSRDCRNLTLTLTLGNSKALTIPFAERRYGLPAFGANLAAARPKTAIPSQSGDGLLLANSLKIPSH